MSRYNLYFNLITEMCNKLEKTPLKKLNDETVWDATLMRFQVIGENIKKIPAKIKKENKEIKWKDFEWFRNQISHEYGEVSKELIKDMILKDIPVLKKEIKNILKTEIK